MRVYGVAKSMYVTSYFGLHVLTTLNLDLLLSISVPTTISNSRNFSSVSILLILLLKMIVFKMIAMVIF